jgi:hypothetical protein
VVLADASLWGIGLDPLRDLKMLEITDREALLMSQVLFTIRTSLQILLNSYLQEEILDLVDKLDEHIVSGGQPENTASMNSVDPVASEDETDESEEEYFFNVADFVELDSLKVVEGKNKHILMFVSAPNGELDVDLDDGEELICSVSSVTRGSDWVQIETNDGVSRKFEVRKFPVSWTSTFELGVKVNVEEEES